MLLYTKPRKSPGVIDGAAFLWLLPTMSNTFQTLSYPFSFPFNLQVSLRLGRRGRSRQRGRRRRQRARRGRRQAQGGSGESPNKKNLTFCNNDLFTWTACMEICCALYTSQQLPRHTLSKIMKYNFELSLRGLHSLVQGDPSARRLDYVKSVLFRTDVIMRRN